MPEKDWILGHEPLQSRLNIREELRRLKRDPLEPLLKTLGLQRRSTMLQDVAGRYSDAYRSYYLCLERFLPEMSLAIRWSTGPYYVRKYGGRYTPAQRRLAARYNKIARFIDLDFFNCMLYARILLDRTISLSRYFLSGGNLPSFVSFDDHKKFFQRQQSPFDEYEEYAAYIREHTDWFDMPLKTVRDKFLVHAGPQHLRVFGFPYGDAELGLMISVPVGKDSRTGLGHFRTIVVSIPQLARDIEGFLTWFCDYGCRAIAMRA